MKLGPQSIVTRVKKAVSRDKDGQGQSNGPGPGVPPGGDGKAVADTGADGSSIFKFRVAPRKSENGKSVTRGHSKKDDNNSSLTGGLPPQLQEQSKAHDHLREYVSSLPISEISIPDYHPRLTRTMQDIKHRNLIYPVGKGTFIHLKPDLTDSRDFYEPIEPSTTNPNLNSLMDQVDKRLTDYVVEIKKAQDNGEMTEELLRCLDKICSVKGGRGARFHESDGEGIRGAAVLDGARQGGNGRHSASNPGPLHRRHQL